MRHSNLLVIDGFSLAFRAFFSMPPTVKLPDGTPVNAVFGFASLLFKGIDMFNPTYLCVCFDVKAPTFRHELYPQYKAHRPEPPAEFIVQIPLLKQFIQNCGIPILEKPGFEADDLLGTLSELADKQEIPSYLMTGDRDSYQLVSEHTSVIITKKGVSEIIEVTPQFIRDQYDLDPKQMIDLKALQGDSSDNIPGVAGVGEKTALKLLHQFPSIEAIYDNLDKIDSASVRQKLETNKEMAYTSYQLAQINNFVPLDISFEQLKFTPDWSKILDTFQTFQFKTLVNKYQNQLKTIGSHNPSQSTQHQTHYTLIDTITKLKDIIPTLKNGFAIDLETTGDHPIHSQIVGIAISTTAREAIYIPLNDYLVTTINAQSGPLFGNPSEDLFQTNPYFDLLKPILEDPGIPKITQNGKYEMTILRNYAIHLKGITFDTMLAAFLLHPEETVGLKDLADRQLGIPMTRYEDIVGKGKEQKSIDQIPVETVMPYACADADITLQLKTHFAPQLKEKKLDHLFTDIELPTQEVLADMEYIGVKIDSTYLQKLSAEFSQKSQVLRQEIIQLAGHEFNVNSTQQLAKVLYDELGLTVHKKTKTGRSTDSSVLEKLKSEHEIATLLLNYRMLEKLQSTYVNALPQLVSYRTGRIHTSFNQTIAITGRLSSTNPNLQNIPIRSEEGRRIRAAFIPSSPDRKILSADYSQIELRILAHLCQDQNMIKAFNQDLDIHQSTAALVFGKALEDVSKEERYRAKAVNFGIIYGSSAFGLAENLGISRSEAKDIIDTYFAQFPAIKTFMDETIQFAKENGYVSTAFGRIRPIPELQERNPMRQKFGERTAINTRVQGTAADLIKLAMCRIHSRLKSEKYQSDMIIQVHDELVFDVVSSESYKLIQLVKQEMESVVTWSVPLKVDAVLGNNWQEIS